MFDFSSVSRESDAFAGADRSPISVTASSRSALLADLETRLAADDGFCLATLNLDHLVKICRDTQFRQAYAAHSHVTADGNPIVWLCSVAGQKNVELIPGSELIEPVLQMAARCGFPIALFGSTAQSLARAAAVMQARHHGLKIAAQIAPPMAFDPEGADAEAAIEALAGSEARLVFLALGAPKQERFAIYAHERLPQVGFLSIGAGLDFISGAQQRAPKLVRLLALEWLWRLGKNPKRLLRRYIDCFAILPRATRMARHARLNNTGS
ncbi:MAG: WecB/TagA/CpsF family glycosyltransferase [Pseudomonadota bacterium]